MRRAWRWLRREIGHPLSTLIVWVDDVIQARRRVFYPSTFVAAALTAWSQLAKYGQVSQNVFAVVGLPDERMLVLGWVAAAAVLLRAIVGFEAGKARDRGFGIARPSPFKSFAIAIAPAIEGKRLHNEKFTSDLLAGGMKPKRILEKLLNPDYQFETLAQSLHFFFTSEVLQGRWKPLDLKSPVVVTVCHARVSDEDLWNRERNRPAIGADEAEDITYPVPPNGLEVGEVVARHPRGGETTGATLTCDTSGFTFLLRSGNEIWIEESVQDAVGRRFSGSTKGSMLMFTVPVGGVPFLVVSVFITRPHAFDWLRLKQYEPFVKYFRDRLLIEWVNAAARDASGQ